MIRLMLLMRQMRELMLRLMRMMRVKKKMMMLTHQQLGHADENSRQIKNGEENETSANSTCLIVPRDK
jgi:hypothetical protein